MRIKIEHATAPDTTVRRLIRGAFALHEVDQSTVEVHVKRAEHLDVRWEVGCDGCGLPRNAAWGHTRRTRRAARAACASGAEPTKTALQLPTASLFSGRAYDTAPHIAQVTPGTRHLVTLRIPDPHLDGFPFVWGYHKAKSATSPEIRSWAEALVYLAGHEARHVRQFQAGLPRSEVDAEAGGMVALQDYLSRAQRPVTGE